MVHDLTRVLDRAERHHARQMRAVEARRARARAGRDEQVVERRRRRARRVPHDAALGVHADDASEDAAEAERIVKVRAHRPELVFAELAEQVVRERGSVVAGARVVGEDADGGARIGAPQALRRRQARRTVADDDEPLSRHPVGPLITPWLVGPRSVGVRRLSVPREGQSQILAVITVYLHYSRFANTIWRAQATGRCRPTQTRNPGVAGFVLGARSRARHQRV